MKNARKIVSCVVDGGKIFTEAIRFERGQDECHVSLMASELQSRNELIASYNEQYGFCKVDLV